MLKKVLRYFSASDPQGAFVVVGLMNLLLPTSPPPASEPTLLPQQHLPTLFHLWSLINRSKTFDINFLDILSRFARDCLPADNIPFSEHGIFTKDQSSLVFTAILRLLDIPISSATSPYSPGIEASAGLSILLDRDQRKHPFPHSIARYIVMSLSPQCLDTPNSILTSLEGLIESIETFFHPSNSGAWTKNLAQLVYYLADFFVMRWNREMSGEMQVHESRRLTDPLKRRFVLCLREVVFMGIYAKSGTAMNFSLSTLQSLAYLEPNLILPGALQRIYPSMQSLVEVHRTTSSLRALQSLTRTMVLTKGFRCHVTSLLGLALPGIDANDLEKTLHTLSYIQAVCYNIPLHDLTKSPCAPHHGPKDSTLALQWVGSEMEKMEVEGSNVELDYENLSSEDEAAILRSSTTSLGLFLTSLLEKLFTLLHNMPDATRVRGGSPEENVINTLPAAFTPLLASLSDDLYDIALEKIAGFVTSTVVNGARDAMAFICNSLCKVNPEKALARLVPSLIDLIRTEIEENSAASTRTVGADVLPRDRALVWYISLLSMCVVHVGDTVLTYEEELLEISEFMQSRCKGIPCVHVSNFVHHLLLNLTATYALDFSLYEEVTLNQGLDVNDWGRLTRPEELHIKWHKPSPAGLKFAAKLALQHIGSANIQLEALCSEESPIALDGTGKDWSDEVSRNLILVRLCLSGMAYVIDSNVIDEESHRPFARLQRSSEDSESSSLVELTPEDQSTDSDSIDSTGQPIPVSWDPNLNPVRPVRGVRVVPSPETGTTRSSQGTFRTSENEGSIDPSDYDLRATDEFVIRPTYKYPAGYPFPKRSRSEEEVRQSNNLYHTFHGIRLQAGEVLRKVHEFLRMRQQDDVTCFNALYSAYRAFFIDVGIERSAHTHDRITRLLAADINPYKVSGLRKEYPRPLLLRRAYVYNLQRLRHNASPRPSSGLDEKMLRDLAESSLSNYVEIRRTAQNAMDSACKSIIGARAILLPIFVEALEHAVDNLDFARIKGAMFSLLFSGLTKTLARDWNSCPRFIKSYIKTTSIDRPSVQKIANASTMQVFEFGRPMERLVLMDEEILKDIVPQSIPQETLVQHKKLVSDKRAAIEERKALLAVELVEIAKGAHWRKASKTVAVVINLGLRFHTIAPPNMVELFAAGAIDDHPSLRALYSGALVALFSLIEARATCNHSYEDYLLDKQKIPTKVSVVTRRDSPDWTTSYLEGFAREETEYYVDNDFPGWLVWDEKMPAYESSPKSFLEYDEVDMRARTQIGKILSRSWFSKFFKYLKQEPREAREDRFRMGGVLLLNFTFELVLQGLTDVTLEEIQAEIADVYGDGSDKHQHRATAEILGGLLCSVADSNVELRRELWDYAWPMIKKIFEDGLTPENSSYWMSFLNLMMAGKDPRRSWPILQWLASFRLDMQSNAAFKESSKIQLLQQCVVASGWHFQLEKPILQDFLAHLDHPYKGVREAIGQTMAAIYRSRYHESYKDVDQLVEAQNAASSVGTIPYKPTSEFIGTMNDVFTRLEIWRGERTPGQQTPSSYTQGSKTVLLWLDSTLSSHECTQLLQFFPDLFMQQFLHMMDVKEDPELQNLAYLVFRHLANIPHGIGEDDAFIETMIRLGKTSPFWHQRLRVLINMQIIYFRRLFMLSQTQQTQLFCAVSHMLEDAQLEVRTASAMTLSGMIRCTPAKRRAEIVQSLQDIFSKKLAENPLTKRSPLGTPTPEQTKTLLKRHAAVLGLGAIVQAFPYQSPPPHWLPQILATLAVKAASDPGAVGKSVKSILSEFKKTRQDTWHVDMKVCDFEY